jgi:hypothetical protein
MNCHSERSEESPHFVRYATVYTYSNNALETGIDDIDQNSDMPRLQGKRCHARKAQRLSARERAGPFGDLPMEVRFVWKDVPVSQPWHPYAVEQVGASIQPCDPQPGFPFLERAARIQAAGGGWRTHSRG